MKRKVLPLIMFIFFGSFLTVNGERVKVVFRYDDFLLKPSALNDSLMDLFSRKKVPLCIGIVPFDASGILINRFDSAQLSGLRSRISRGEVEVALHGFNHMNHIKKRRFTKPTYSEWADIPYSDQLKKLSYGKEILDSLLGTDIKVFVPPFNTYDDNTLKALEALGFEIISGSRQGSSNGKSIKFMPSTYEDFSSLPEIVENNRDKDVSVIVYFHPYTFKGGSDMNSTRTEGNMTIKDLDSVLTILNSGNTLSLSFSGLSKTGDFNGDSFRNNSMKYNLLKKALNYTKHYSYGTLSSGGSTISDNLLTAGNIILHLLVFGIVFLMSVFILNFFNRRLNLVVVFMSILLITVSAYLVYIRHDYSFGMIVFMLIVIFSALIAAILKVYKGRAGHSFDITRAKVSGLVS